ncbi:MAG: hypothetical protein PVG79_11050, partial [Gemmatimonadales bacterium]
TGSHTLLDVIDGVGSDLIGLEAGVIPVVPIEVEIDVKPGGEDNPINLKSKGLIPVAILTTAGLDAGTINPATVTLGDEEGSDTPVAERRNGTLAAALEDIDVDGDFDLILHFETQALVDNGDLTCATTELVLSGETTAGSLVRGGDAVQPVGCTLAP